MSATYELADRHYNAFGDFTGPFADDLYAAWITEPTTLAEAIPFLPCLTHEDARIDHTGKRVLAVTTGRETLLALIADGTPESDLRLVARIRIELRDHLRAQAVSFENDARYGQ